VRLGDIFPEFSKSLAGSLDAIEAITVVYFSMMDEETKAREKERFSKAITIVSKYLREEKSKKRELGIVHQIHPEKQYVVDNRHVRPTRLVAEILSLIEKGEDLFSSQEEEIEKTQNENNAEGEPSEAELLFPGEEHSDIPLFADSEGSPESDGSGNTSEIFDPDKRGNEDREEEDAPDVVSIRDVLNKEKR
jgi:hypothetical protein